MGGGGGRFSIRRAGVAALVAVMAAAALWEFSAIALATPRTPFDEPLWYHRSLIWPTSHEAGTYAYFAAIDVPAFNRWSYGIALRAAGLEGLHCPHVDYSNYGPENWTKLAPIAAVHAMRYVNAAFALATVAVLMALGRALLGHWSGVLLGAPLMLSTTYALAVVPRLGPDVFLAFWLVASAAAWTMTHVRGRALEMKALLLNSALIGMAIASKYNAGLILAGYCGYLAVKGRGWDRLARPLAAMGVSFIVFAAVDPVVLSDFPNVHRHLAAIWQRRLESMAAHDGRQGSASMFFIGASFMPYWPLVPAFAALLWSRRREAWFAPMMAWSVPLVVGTILTANQPHERYRVPVDLGVYVPVTLAALSALRDKARRGAE